MKPTNYHLFDFLDFDPDLSRDESLWKAYKPTSVYEKDGDICINVPFYNPQNEMFRLLGTKRSFSQNETFFFSHP